MSLRYADLVIPINVSVSYEYIEGIEGDDSIPNGTNPVFFIEDVTILDYDSIRHVDLDEYVIAYEKGETL